MTNENKDSKETTIRVPRETKLALDGFKKHEKEPVK